MKRIYIAGKISDLPLEEYTANFEVAEKELREMGFLPVSPIKLPHNHDKSWNSYMREDLQMMLGCDGVYALKNWQQSKGARIEIELAQKLGMKIIFD